jgi:hypothetical protein
MAKVIAALMTVTGFGRLMVVYRVNKFITLFGRREFVTVLKETCHCAPF